MPQVTDSIDVKAPISAVYALWTQFEDFPKFMGGVESITQQTDTMLHWVVSIKGVEREFDAEITEQHLDERVAWRSTDGETHAGVVTFHRIDDDMTRVNVQIDWKPQGVVEAAGALLQVDDLQIKQDLKRFKELAEAAPAQQAVDQGWDGDVERPADRLGQ
ncbi:SRPBCC family protein [Agrococcus sp. Marseille-Q4369]|uniref:SRPBCC family protein n=1 Tax=Agrococcus sp. Marseille-Q4369 TaxID=2810513 RepID=UPI001B8AC42D|nr:SRPBCC family protein [Agrococcus sp. Marseille-Q4369]QUW18301.1 SRPBCC family protein [Agrococcus sp. Marseille-Q4369]